MARRASDVLLDILRDEGITHIFGNPGSTEMPLMDALVDASDITYVLGLQEATAVGMADGWALSSGKVGFVNLHAMGGLGNAMGVLVASMASETPLVVTAGQQDTRHLMTEPWLSGDLVALAAPVTKWAKEVRRGEDVGSALRRAFAIARTPPCGPVFLSLPMDVLDQPVESETPPASAPPRLGASPDVEVFAEALASYDPDKVFILLGDDLPAAAAAGLVAFAEAGGYPVWGTQLTSRSAFPSAHPCWSGVLKPDFAVIRERLEATEALVLVGGRAFVAYPYRDVRPIPEGTKVFHVSDDPAAFGREHPADLALLGDIGATLQGCAHRLAHLLPAPDIANRLSRRAAAKLRHIETLRAEIMRDQQLSPLTADVAVLTVFDALPDSALIANDSAATFGKVQELMMTRPGRYFFSRGGVLGCNQPAAVGAALAHDGPVVSLAGDGGAMYSPQALWSAAHYRTKVIFIVFNNRRYGVLQNIAKQLGCPNANQDRFVGMNIEQPAIDFMALAASMGVPAVRADETQAIRDAIATALGRDGPSLIEIAIR
ncbi:benzoylformate decarboxylase [Rhodopseudomonas faecalis]|uniref:Benzoylformate decarboxylase n=1 Tax=Rhodopseudomonas faecalis TaxID=99655 RepID=A0A318TLI7_9BRAD|nr:thiamine pyrophosphate-binding protein [Rhodopseudomonas faecalis]PYF02725.1 benzoylformate decarboxylase [Rhodopseudomonas faecalis]